MNSSEGYTYILFSGSKPKSFVQKRKKKIQKVRKIQKESNLKFEMAALSLLLYLTTQILAKNE